MKKKTRKLLSMMCAALLLVCVTVGATYAYLTSTDTVTNTFTVGNVAITLDETDVNENGEKDSEERVKANSYKLMPGHTYIKDPTVTVKGGSEECYVRLLVTVTEKAALDAIGVNTLEVFEGYDANEWKLSSQTANGDTMVYEFYYKSTVAKNASDTKLDALFDKIVMPGNITNEQLATLDELKITVVANAIQADGFATADAAWGAWK